MTKEDQNNGPLSSVRILDFTRILAGPTCTQLLGDYGADVIKVEKPGLGDDTRAWGPPYTLDTNGKATKESAYYLSANRNKRSLALDISNPKDVEVIKAIILQCDVFVENFKVGGLKKFGLDYASLKLIKPSLIYCSITGFGQTGPNAHKPGYDLLAQAFGGIMSLTGEPNGEPMKVGVGVADVVCGLYAATAILAALRQRDASQDGQYIDISLADTQVSWLVNAGTNYLMSKKEQPRLGNAHPNIVPYQVFEASDGYLIVAAGNDAQFKRFCDILKRPDLANNDKFNKNIARIENRDELIKILSREILKFKKKNLLEQMEKKSISGGMINSLSEVFSSEQVSAREMRIKIEQGDSIDGFVELIGNPVKFDKNPVTYRRPPPKCGEHNDEIIQELLGEEFRKMKGN
jgi:crotonobetainyl-CoA:carnitine CoA-transferase CaiB-like acyl-CoA transferase